MSHLINILVEPGKTFAALKEKPTFWLPVVLMIVLSAVMVLGYFNKVDSDWLTEHQLAASGKEMSASEIEQAKAVMPSAPVMGWFGVVFGSIGVLLVMAILALYYMLAGKITGNAVSFRHGMTLAAWPSIPALLGMIVAIVGIVLMTPQTALESLMLTNFDPLLVQLPVDHAWSSFVKNFSLLTFWSIALAAIGWRTWGKTSWGQAITVALIPSLLTWAVMAAFALAKS